ncbi:hypothetical protein D0867_04269 [Hortaea werneckii]|uniref:Nucleolar complex-associated protein 3 n=1 Tax=Hortaea werneckii TaxID=91943 RepID=A0A3M7B7K5_HORWE|nr:nucleolar complex-associated protein 3 [Hortaea werneckii]KAI7021557.1 nucleolar complex-associated protein 3 [Hortaea werneckii]RMY20063.1 hypothetical protein D0867_04269 [Hortaea werneckii]RMY35716.1 hypothetical protein D0866_04415 [Hortaea werneckii]
MAPEPANKRRKLSPPTNNVPGFAKWNLEQDYEQRPRKRKDAKSEKLPVKTAEGWKENQRQEPEDARQEQDDDADSFLASGDEGDGAEKDSGVADLEPKPKPAPKPRLPPKEEIRQAKEDLARIAGNISEDPEENIGQLGSLAHIAESENVTVQKLALGTQLAVYKDIIPGYRIRPLTKDDMNAKLSKDVRKLRSFEQSLLGGYKDYVKSLEKLASDDKLAAVATGCACNLITSVPHFNCRNELLAILVKKLSTRHFTTEGVKCVEALEQLFRDDEEGHASLEAVSQLTKMLKSRNYQVHESALNSFLHLRLLSEFSQKASTTSVDKDQSQSNPKEKMKKKDREFRTKRERKLVKERKAVEKEMKEADAAVSYETRDKNQAETLKMVFVAYFRILKARVQHLMGAVLEGLAKYAHLINQDFFGDVLEALKDLINDAEYSLHASEENQADEEQKLDDGARRNAVRESMLCIITAFALLQGQQDVVKSVNTLHLDLNFFITHLYRTLLPLAMETDLELSAKNSEHLSDPNGLPVTTSEGGKAKVNVATTTVLLLRSLQSVLLPPTGTRLVPPVRVAAFAKQLMTLSLHLPQKSAVAVTGLLQQVTKTHGSKISSLWNTEERKGDGVFDALSEEVESSNPFAGTVWEGELLRMHWDPRVRDSIKAIEGNVKEGR